MSTAKMAIFDTFKFVQKAKLVGFTEEQAVFQAEELASLLRQEIATKADLLRAKEDLLHTIRDIKNEILIKLGSMLVVGIGILGFMLRQ